MTIQANVLRRLDLHNVSTDFTAASLGLCGFTDLNSGRVCQLPHRHPGACQLQEREWAHHRAAHTPD